MADTERTISAILTLFADNATGAISEQDLRDFVVSISPAYGGMYISTAAQTAIATVSTPVKALGTTTIAGSVRGVDMPANNRLRYTGTPTRWFTVDVSMSVITAAANKSLSFFIYKTGVQEANSEMVHKHLVAADVNLIAMTWHLQLATNDYIEVWVENTTDNGNMTINQMAVTMQGIIE